MTAERRRHMTGFSLSGASKTGSGLSELLDPEHSSSYTSGHLTD